MSTSLPALRPTRRHGQVSPGEANAAARDFGRALDNDSTFGLAGLALRMAAVWYGDNAAAERGLRLAYQARGRLSPRDRALLEAVSGPRYPAQSSTIEVFQARQRYLNLAPDRASLGTLRRPDLPLRTILGYLPSPHDALAAFRRSLDLDSTNAVAFSHILLLAVQEGDTALERRVVRLSGLLPDSTSRGWLAPYHWYKAHLAETARLTSASGIR
jgi:hypothetical protein